MGATGSGFCNREIGTDCGSPALGLETLEKGALADDNNI